MRIFFFSSQAIVAIFFQLKAIGCFAFASPMQRIKAAFDVTMEGRVRPIRNLLYVTVFERIDVAIINVCRIITVIANHMFPKPALPQAAFTACDAHL